MKTIEIASESEVIEIFDLVRQVFPSNGLVNLGVDVLRENIRQKNYISFIARIDNRIVGHAGVLVNDGISFLGGLVVSPEFRGRGIGRKLADSRTSYCLEEDRVSHIVLYSILNHRNSQTFYDDSFIPVGLCVEQKNKFSPGDPLYQLSSSYEIVLCRPKFNRERRIISNGGLILSDRIQEIYNSINIKIEFNEGSKTLDGYITKEQMIGIDLSSPYAKSFTQDCLNQDYIFTGLLPNCQKGLGILGFAKNNQFLKEVIKYKPRVASRDRFIESIFGGDF